MRRDLVAAEQLAPAILRHIVELGQHHKEEQQPDAASDRVHGVARHEQQTMWESVNTVIIKPQERVPTARRKPSVCPRSTMSGGRNRNIYTGTNTMNMPYQSIAAQ